MEPRNTDWEERFGAYLDGELAADEVRALEEALAASPELAAELERYRATVAVLRGLGGAGAAPPPDRFMERVEGRIRRRSRGRFFSVESKLRLPYEAIATIILLAVMAFLFLSAGGRVEAPTIVRPGPGGVAAAEQTAPHGPGLLEPFGDVTRSADGSASVTVAPAQLGQLTNALRSDPTLEVVERAELPDGRVRVTVRPRQR